MHDLPGQRTRLQCILFQDVLSQVQHLTVEPSFYSPDQAPADLYVYPKAKSALKGIILFTPLKV